MNGRTATLLNNYSGVTGKDKRDVKNWWRSLTEKARCKSRRDMTTIVQSNRKKIRDEREALEAKEAIPRGGDCS